MMVLLTAYLKGGWPPLAGVDSEMMDLRMVFCDGLLAWLVDCALSSVLGGRFGAREGTYDDGCVPLFGLGVLVEFSTA